MLSLVRKSVKITAYFSSLVLFVGGGDWIARTVAVFIVSKKQTRKRDNKHRQLQRKSSLTMSFSQNNLLESPPFNAIHSLLRQCQIFWVWTTHRILSDLARFRHFDYCTFIRDASLLGWMTCLYLPVRCPKIVTLFRVSECCHYIGVPQRNHHVKSELRVSQLHHFHRICRHVATGFLGSHHVVTVLNARCHRWEKKKRALIIQIAHPWFQVERIHRTSRNKFNVYCDRYLQVSWTLYMC
jgi:hypothetical protein